MVKSWAKRANYKSLRMSQEMIQDNLNIILFFFENFSYYLPTYKNVYHFRHDYLQHVKIEMSFSLMLRGKSKTTEASTNLFF